MGQWRDEERWQIEDRLIEAVRAAQAAFDRASIEAVGRAKRVQAAQDLKIAVDRLLDYVMLDKLPPGPER
jgi:hypothetical protein